MRIEVLDFGYVELVEAWGKGRQALESEYSELHYDYEDATPFEFAGMVIEVQAPIFVFREWHCHRTLSYNEMSARYVPLPDLYYTPSKTNLLVRPVVTTQNKQAGTVSSSRPLTGIAAKLWLERLENLYRIAEAHYQNALAEGIPEELARLVMPVGHYSRMRASANLHNWLGFLPLRRDPAAQWEIRQYAEAVGKIIEATFPQTYSLWFEEFHRV